ncbi:PAS domain-containing protein [Actinotignum urinale]|uniref:helix-turn-helix transcriptional regulator n=1 Tax=Actinotignum urinale TaxID=190146 RepID=UPI002A800BD5|nr:PAS domain-containing protein [Actinotignum urinale]MDY5151526.1 PAS domain-containing protein [Actinotignum urinale]
MKKDGDNVHHDSVAEEHMAEEHMVGEHVVEKPVADKPVAEKHTAEIEENSAYVAQFIPLVEFLGVAIGANSEVVLHDVANLDNSVIAIANGHISGRRIGSPATDLMLRVLKAGSKADMPYLTGYEAITPGDKRTLHSATFFIRRRKKIVGMLCINTDHSAFENLDNAVKTLLAQFVDPEKHAKTSVTTHTAKPEILSASVEDMKSEAIGQAIARIGISPTHLTQTERLRIVSELDEDGFFQLRGAVIDLAHAIDVSEPTIYRYLKQVRESE